jgi:hypothetical protein
MRACYKGPDRHDGHSEDYRWPNDPEVDAPAAAKWREAMIAMY